MEIVMMKKYTKEDGDFIIINAKRGRDRTPIAWKDEIVQLTGVEPAKFYASKEEAQVDADKINAYMERSGRKFKYVVKDVSPKKPDPRRQHTCQICGRAILANTGVIAHHGYRRPDGWGVQTASCIGALELPYEQDRSVLGKYIEQLKEQLNNNKNSLKKFIKSNDAITKIEQEYKNYKRVKVETVIEPDMPGYKTEKDRQIYTRENTIRHLTDYLKWQQERFNK